MKTSVEVQVLQWFERALAQRPEARRLWLADQDMDEAVRERVLRLLDADQASGDFLEETAVAEEALPPEFPKVGERLGAYELLKPLESGGMGVVYLGRRADDVYDQQVAIKLVRPVHLLAAAEFRRQLISRFEDERSILARMSHPNVARILDGGSTAAGIPYLVMEYVDGVPLTDYCKQNKLDVRARLALFGKVCDGVQEAHRHLIVHRDLKPDNILVGDNGEPRLLDFGIAKILEQEPLPANGKRQTSLSAMTPAYASPEQVRQQTLTTSSDVYSLGVMLYQLLAGVRPYELGGLRPSEAEAVVCDTLPDPMRKKLEKAAITDAERKARRAQITQDIERIVAKAMHKEPGRRYGSAQELADDIRRYLDGRPVLAHPDSTGYRVRKFVRRHRWGVAVAAVGLVAVLTSAVVAGWQAREARRAAEDMEQINSFLKDVLAYSDPFVAGGTPTLAQAVDAAVMHLDRQFADRPDLAAGARQVLGTSQLKRGNVTAAREQLEKALRDATAAYGPRSELVFNVRESLAQVANHEGRVEEASAALASLHADLKAEGMDEGWLYFTVLNNRADLLIQQERYREASELLAEADAMPLETIKGLAPDSRAVVRANQAYVAHSLGHLEEARALYEEAESMHLDAVPEGSADLWILHSNLAFLLTDMGLPEEALALRKRSLAEQRKVMGEDNPHALSLMFGIVIAALEQGQVDYARKTAREAMELSERGLPQPHRETIMARLVLARVLRDAGELADSADLLSTAESELDKLDSEPAGLHAAITSQRRNLCARASEVAVKIAACAGVSAPEN